MVDVLVDRAMALARRLERSSLALPTPRPSSRVISAGFVAAPGPPPAQPVLLPLSLLDAELYMGGCINATIWYSAQLDGDKLRAATSQCLALYPPLAGRLVSLPPPGGGGARSQAGDWRRGAPRGLLCNNAGASFTELSCAGVAMPSERDAQRPAPFPRMWQGPELYTACDRDEAVLDILLVRYADGCSLTLSTSHAVSDGISISAFVACIVARCAGAELAQLPPPELDRGVYDAACGVHGQVWAPPRARCRAPSADQPVHPAPGEKLPSVSPLGGFRLWPGPAALARLLLRGLSDASLGLVPGAAAPERTVLRLPAASLARLKTRAQAEAGERLSSNDVLAAALWRLAAAVRRRRGALDDAARCGESLTFVASTRTLLLQPEQEGYLGNATVCLRVGPLPRKQLLHEMSLGEVALAVRRAKAAALTPEAVRSEMGWLQSQALRGRYVGWNQLPIDGNTLLFDWSFVPVYDIELPSTSGVTVKPLCFEMGLGGAHTFPHVLGALPAPGRDGLVVHASLPGDELPHALRLMSEL